MKLEHDRLAAWYPRCAGRLQNLTATDVLAFWFAKRRFHLMVTAALLFVVQVFRFEVFRFSCRIKSPGPRRPLAPADSPGFDRDPGSARH